MIKIYVVVTQPYQLTRGKLRSYWVQLLSLAQQLLTSCRMKNRRFPERPIRRTNVNMHEGRTGKGRVVIRVRFLANDEQVSYGVIEARRENILIGCADKHAV